MTVEQMNFVNKVKTFFKKFLSETSHGEKKYVLWEKRNQDLTEAMVSDAGLELENKGEYIDQKIADLLGQEDQKELEAIIRKDHLIIPEKFRHVDLKAMLQNISQIPENSEQREEEMLFQLKQVLKKVHPWSSLHYGLLPIPMIKRLYTETIPKYYGKDVEIQVLTPMARGNLGAHNLNRQIQSVANPPDAHRPELVLGERTFRTGDRVIQKRNNYDLGVFNGDIGIIESVDKESYECQILFSGKDSKVVVYTKESLSEVDLAYAITIHKSQGSEFPVVIIPIFTQHYKMLFRNLIYTGLTRAKKLAVFVGSRRALTMSALNINSSKRQTGLVDILDFKKN